MGKKWLTTAAEERGGNATFDLKLTRRPFFLYPGGRHEISGWGDRLDALYPGGRQSIAALGKHAGFNFDFSAPLSDTLDSHRLVLWADAQEPGKGEALAAAIGHQYFERAKPLADHDMLCACAVEVGLDGTAARAYLASDDGFAEVRASVAHNLRRGIRSIPVFVFQSGGFEEVVHGSADVARFGQVLDAILAHARTKEEL